jgi:hypothetical protein
MRLSCLPSVEAARARTGTARIGADMTLDSEAIGLA